MRSIGVCFVCLGNICRSPTAEGIFLSQVRAAGLASRVRVDSAGTAAFHVGNPADARSAAAAHARGVALPSRARRFERADFESFDFVIAMDRANQSDLLALAADADAQDKVRLLRSFDPAAPHDAEVPDPYYGGPSGFEHVFDLCEVACRGLLAHVRSQLS